MTGYSGEATRTVPFLSFCEGMLVVHRSHLDLMNKDDSYFARRTKFYNKEKGCLHDYQITNSK